jgi:hypothetical protein
VLAVTSWRLPGLRGMAPVPESPDGEHWRRAWPSALDLGADDRYFWERTAPRGLVVPETWLATGSWWTLRDRAAVRRRSRPRPGR